MKKLVLFLSAAVVFLFTACQKDALTTELNTNTDSNALTVANTEEVTITDEAMMELTGPDALLKRKKIKIEDLLPEITTYIGAHYAGATIVDAYKDDKGNFYVIIKDATGVAKVLTFDKTGAFVKESTLPDKGDHGKADSIIKNIKTYVHANYPGASIGHIQKNKDGSINVMVKTKDGKVVILNFDKNGNFVKIVTPPTGGGHGNGLDSTVVFNIKHYLSNTYPDASYGGIEKGKDGGYSVVVKSKDGKITVVYFDKDGKFVKAVTPTTGSGGLDSTVVSNIRHYLSTNYPDSFFGAIEKGKDGGYSVVVKSKDGKVTTVYFDKDGKFIKAVPQTTGGGGTGGIDPNVLSAIKSYLNEHYSGASFGDVVPIIGGGYMVIVKTKDGKVYTVVFDKNGKFVKVTP